jgi:hypothetical protein
MKSFKEYLIETNLSMLLEGKELHQFVNQHGDKILKNYEIPYDNSKIPPNQQTEHKTDFITRSLGIHDMPLHHQRWALKQVVKGNIPNLEDLKSTITDHLNTFEEHKDAHKMNLDKVNNPTELFNIAQKHNPETTTKDIPTGEFTLHGENEHWKVVQPHTKSASCTLGGGTNWCTSSKSNNRFTHYNKSGPLMVLLPKKPLYKGEKYQWHPEQFMNKEDRTINSSETNLPKLSFHDRPLPEFNHQSRFDIQLSVDLTDPKASEQHLLKSVKDPKNNSERHIRSALKSPYESVAMAAFNHPNFFTGNDNMANALESPHQSVAMAAVKDRKFNPDTHWLPALESPYESVATAAVKHPRFDAVRRLEDTLESRHASIALAAVNHPAFAQHKSPWDENFEMELALKSPHESVALAAVKHPQFGTSNNHINVGLNSPHESVALVAVNHPKFNYLSHAAVSPHESVKKLIDTRFHKTKITRRKLTK